MGTSNSAMTARYPDTLPWPTDELSAAKAKKKIVTSKTSLKSRNISPIGIFGLT